MMEAKFFRIKLLAFLLLTSLNIGAQDLIVSKQGELFQCVVDSITDDSVYFSFDYLDKDHNYVLGGDHIAYCGKNFLESPSGSHDNSHLPDLIVTNGGEILYCKIRTSSRLYLIYAFFIDSKEFRNRIDKKDIAYVRRSYQDNLDLEKESTAFYDRILSKELSPVEELITPTIELASRQRKLDSINLSLDLIVKVTGEELACRVDGIGVNSVNYSFFMNGSTYHGEINKREVHYLLKDHLSSSAERIYISSIEEVVDDEPEKPFDTGEIIITQEGETLECKINHVGLNTIEFSYADSGVEYNNIIEKSEVIYYGPNFVNSITELDHLKNSKYKDLIYTKKRSVLFCDIEHVSSFKVEYSFEINKTKHYNFVDKDDLIYYGINFFNENSKAESEGDQAQRTRKTTVPTVDIPVDSNVDTEPPRVIILSPELATKNTFEAVPADINSIALSGLIQDSSQIKKVLINGTEVTVTENGEFTADIALKTGENEISVKALDIYENETSSVYNIERLEPVHETVAEVPKDILPPEIRIYAPRIDQSTGYATVSNQTKRITVTGNVTDKSGVFEVLVNGKDAVLSGTGDFSSEVLLKIGENPITIQATDVQSNYAKQSLTIKREDAFVNVSVPTLLEEGSKYYGMLIGVSDYNDPLLPDLDDHPTQDVEKLYQILKDYYSFDAENIKLMLNPNRADILKTFDRLSKIITEKDNLLIFFAGHGYYNEETELGYWLPADAEADYTANWIYNDVLVANLKRIRSKHTLLISDACFSGSIFRTRTLPINAPMAYKKKYDLCSRKAITSGVLKTVPNKSVFFKYLSSRLESNQEPYMSASELFRSLEIAVGNNSPNSPQYGVIQNVGDEGGDFIFVRSNNTVF